MNRQRQQQPQSPLHLPGGVIPPMMQQQEPVVQVAAPMNDTQLIATLATQIYGSGILKSPKEAVDMAFEITAWARVGILTNVLGMKLEQIAATMPKPPESDAPAG